MSHNYVEQNMYAIDIFNDDCCWRCDHITNKQNRECKFQEHKINRVGKCDKYQGLTVIEQIDKNIIAECKKEALKSNPILDTVVFDNGFKNSWLNEKMKTLCSVMTDKSVDSEKIMVDSFAHVLKSGMDNTIIDNIKNGELK